jgi:diguanylate cyclase (GGDEF)-like protein
MLTYAIGFVQNVQLICFAVVLTFMAMQNRDNAGLRWLALGYISGLTGAVLDFGGHWLPAWLSPGVSMEAAPVGYACFHACAVQFVRRGWRTRWLSVLLAGGSLPFFLLWAHREHMSQSATLQDFILAVQTLMTSVLIVGGADRETRWPRRTIGGFLAVYSVVEFLRVGLFLTTGKMPGKVSPALEVASGIVYVVSCSVLPLAFIWMMNARLLSHLNRLAAIDPLTELLNRRALRTAGEHEIENYRRTRRDFAVVVVDIDHFKAVNDRLGHACGDEALRVMAGFLQRAVRAGDTVGRLGGEEFIILLPGMSPAEAHTEVEYLRTGFREQAMKLGGEEVRLTASFGIAVSGGRGDLTWETMVREADTALYAAKNAGRNATKMYDKALAATAKG